MNQLSKSTVTAILDSINGPPGITHPLFVEKYAWVDERLEELYYDYTLTTENRYNYMNNGLYKMTWMDYIESIEQSQGYDQGDQGYDQGDQGYDQGEQGYEIYTSKYMIIENKENSDSFSEVSTIISEDSDCYDSDEWYMYNELIC
jgi:hypothetical protein